MLDLQQPKQQARFRKQFSTIDHIFTINQICERAREYNVNLNFMFIDFNKAFDTIHHESVRKALYNQGVGLRLIKILKNIYNNSKAYIQLNMPGEVFKLERGVKQRDPLSLNLFDAVLEEILKNVNWEGKGFKCEWTTDQ